jgi:4-hydroxy-2-oxoglutarate aldolase
VGDFVPAGLYPPLVTPFDADGELDERALRRNVSAYGAAPLAGYVVLGTTGEFPHLTTAEKERVIAAVVEEAAGRPVLAQTGEPSLRATVALTRRAAELGASAVLVVTPSYYRSSMRRAELEAYYRGVADASPVPVLLYNIPQNTGVNLDPELVAALAEHPNIVGIKDSSGNLGQLAETVALTPPGWGVLTGSASIFVAAMVHGARGGILAAANVLPFELCDLLDLAGRGDVPGAARLFGRLAPVLRLLARLGIPGYKAAMDVLGYAGGHPRQPLLPLGEAERDRIVDALRSASLARY